MRGRLVREPRPGTEHGWLQVELARRLAAFVEERGFGGIVASDFGIVLSTEPPTVRGPDLGYVSAERLPAEGIPVGFLRAAPDLAVEIVSPSNTASEIQERVLDYLDAGTRLVWVVDPATRSASVYRSREDITVVSGDEALAGGDVLPGLRVSLAALFRRRESG